MSTAPVASACRPIQVASGRGGCSETAGPIRLPPVPHHRGPRADHCWACLCWWCAMIPLARIATLIRSLGRENDHEIVATARAIGAALRGADCDFHDLADAVESSQVGCAYSPRPAAARSSAVWAPSHRAGQAKSDRDRVTWLVMYGTAALTDWEVGFVDSLVRQLSRRGAIASPKQSARLGQIFARATRRAA